MLLTCFGSYVVSEVWIQLESVAATALVGECIYTCSLVIYSPWNTHVTVHNIEQPHTSKPWLLMPNTPYKNYGKCNVVSQTWRFTLKLLTYYMYTLFTNTCIICPVIYLCYIVFVIWRNTVLNLESIINYPTMHRANVSLVRWSTQRGYILILCGFIIGTPVGNKCKKIVRNVHAYTHWSGQSS